MCICKSCHRNDKLTKNESWYLRPSLYKWQTNAIEVFQHSTASEGRQDKAYWNAVPNKNTLRWMPGTNYTTVTCLGTTQSPLLLAYKGSVIKIGTVLFLNPCPSNRGWTASLCLGIIRDKRCPFHWWPLISGIVCPKYLYFALPLLPLRGDCKIFFLFQTVLKIPQIYLSLNYILAFSY